MIFLLLVKFIAKLCHFITQVSVPPVHHFKWLTLFSLYLPLCLSSLGLRGMKMISRQRNEISLCLVGIFYSKWKSSGTKSLEMQWWKYLFGVHWVRSQIVSDMLASWQGLSSLETCTSLFNVVHLGGVER